MARTLSLGLAHEIAIDAPLVTMHKSDVIRLGVELKVPFELTLSCMNPRHGLHCGQCSKCRERRDAFHEAGIDDPDSVRVNACTVDVRSPYREILIEPSPLRSRSVRPPFPSCARSESRFSRFSRLSLSRSAWTGRPSACTPPSPVCASRSASRFAGSRSVIDPSPVLTLQSVFSALPSRTSTTNGAVAGPDVDGVEATSQLD